jgi:hypothetical protein
MKLLDNWGGETKLNIWGSVFGVSGGWINVYK